MASRLAPPPWISTGRAGRLIGVSDDAVRAYWRLGKLPGFITPTGRLMVERAAIERMAMPAIQTAETDEG